MKHRAVRCWRCGMTAKRVMAWRRMEPNLVCCFDKRLPLPTDRLPRKRGGQ